MRENFTLIVIYNVQKCNIWELIKLLWYTEVNEIHKNYVLLSVWWGVHYLAFTIIAITPFHSWHFLLHTYVTFQSKMKIDL